MQNGTADGTPAQSDDRDAVVTDLTSLLGRIQASMALIEAAVAREASVAPEEMATNVVVLDDVTPCYLKAGAALRACDASLGVALHFLRDPLGSEHGTNVGNHRPTAHGPDRSPCSAIN